MSGKAHHFAKAAGQKGGAGTVAKPGADAGATGDGDHVLQRSAELGPEDIGRAVEPKALC